MNIALRTGSQQIQIHLFVAVEALDVAPLSFHTRTHEMLLRLSTLLPLSLYLLELSAPATKTWKVDASKEITLRIRNVQINKTRQKSQTNMEKSTSTKWRQRSCYFHSFISLASILTTRASHPSIHPSPI